MGILIKNGEIVTASDRYLGDIYCADGKIQMAGPGLQKQSAQDAVIDASGQFVFPGGVDAHVHMELPVMGTESADDFETGTAAGVAGGTTSIIDFVTPARNQSLLDGLALRSEKARKAVSDYGFHMAVTWFGDRTREEMRTCVLAEGIPSFKTFMAYQGTIGIDDTDLIAVMQTAQELGALVTVHAEHGEAVAAIQKLLVEQGKVTPEYHA